MARSNDPYNAGGKWLGPYPHRTEIDLRQEFDNMLDGIYPEIAKAQPYLLRRFLRNSDLSRIPCGYIKDEVVDPEHPKGCVSRLTQEPDRDTFCPICHGEGYMWEEVLIDVYRKSTVGTGTGPLQDQMKPAGIQNIDLYSFWFKSSVPVTNQDKIVTVALDEEGHFSEPIHRQELWRIGLLLDLRSDNGRLEFWQAFAYAEKRTFLNGPTRRYEDK